MITTSTNAREKKSITIGLHQRLRVSVEGWWCSEAGKVAVGLVSPLAMRQRFCGVGLYPPTGKAMQDNVKDEHRHLWSW